jgi:hypothetical protein
MFMQAPRVLGAYYDSGGPVNPGAPKPNGTLESECARVDYRVE